MSRGVAPTALPARMPQLAQNPWRAFCRGCLRVAGWRLVGELPDLPKLVLIAAPHSSWWDGVWGLLFKVGIGADITFVGKRELFRGPLGWLLRSLGGIPVARGETRGVVAQMRERFRDSDKLWLGIAPEGTRRKVKRWRSGFWHIAHAAQVPVLPVYFDYPSKTIGIGKPFATSADVGADMRALRAFYRPFRGRHHDA